MPQTSHSTKGFEFIELDSVDSTNRYLKDYCQQQRPEHLVFCQTHQQTAGYGQQQRQWSTNQDSLIFSMAYPLAAKAQINGLISLQIAKLLHQCLKTIHPQSELFLKWPNDLYNQQGKVAGVLIEQVLDKNYRALIIGIGINRHSPETDEMLADIELASAVDDFDSQGFFQQLQHLLNNCPLTDINPQALLDYWQNHDYFDYQENLQLIEQNHRQLVQYMGVNADGTAQVIYNNQIKLLASGQSSLRKIR